MRIREKLASIERLIMGDTPEPPKPTVVVDDEKRLRLELAAREASWQFLRMGGSGG